MTDDNFTEVTSESWFGRIKNALTGILFGLLLVVGSASLLFWNEGRTIKRHRALQEGSGAVVSVEAETPNPEMNGKLIHLSGTAVTNESLEDLDFGVSINAIRLRRVVEMYQWDQEEKSKTKKKLGGGTETETTYAYKKVWSDDLINSAQFKKSAGHENPTSMPWSGSTLSAKNVTIGSFRLSPNLISEISNFEELPLGADSVEVLQQSGRVATLQGAAIYIGESPAAPQVGDLKVSFSVVRPAVVSVVAKQDASALEAYVTSNKQEIELLQVGSFSAEEMFEAAEAENNLMKWLLRALGLFLMFMAFSLILKPISVVTDVIPFFGNIAETGVGCISVILGVFFGLIVIAVAWFFYRPLVSVLLIAIAVAPIVLFFIRKGKKSESSSTS